MVEGRGSGGEGVVGLGARCCLCVVGLGTRCCSPVVVLVPCRCSCMLVLGTCSCSHTVVVGPCLLVSLAPCCCPRVADEGGARSGEGVEEGTGHHRHSCVLVLGPCPFVI